MSDDRSLEARRLLNPAFCGALISAAAAAYEKEANTGMPYLYVFLVLPIVLHPDTRERLPRSAATRLVTWTERNGEVIAQVPKRMADLAPASRSGLLFASTCGAVRFGTARPYPA